MPILDLLAEEPFDGQAASATPIRNAFIEIMAAVNGLDAVNFASGQIFDPAKIQAAGAIAGKYLVYTGSQWAPASIGAGDLPSSIPVTLLAGGSPGDVLQMSGATVSWGSPATTASPIAPGTVMWTANPYSTPSGFLYCDGSNQSRATYPSLLGALTSAQTGTLTNASQIVTGLTDTSLLAVGDKIEGTNVPAGTTVSSIDSPTQIHMSQNATGSGSPTLTFFRFGNGDGVNTFGLPPLKGVNLAGLDTGQTEFNTIGKTGGEKTHVLITSELAAHTHGVGSYAVASHSHGSGTLAVGSHTHNQGTLNTLVTYANVSAGAGLSAVTTGTTGNFAPLGNTGATAPSMSGSTGSASPALTGSGGSTGSDGAHNNLPPYITLRPIIKT